MVIAPELTGRYAVSFAMGSPPPKRIQKVSRRKEGKPKNRPREVEIMTGTVFLAPSHGRYPMKSLAHVRQDDNGECARANQLQRMADRSGAPP